MDKRVQDSVIAKQEKAARQQELLEKKRQARAEYNISGGRSGEQREKASGTGSEKTAEAVRDPSGKTGKKEKTIFQIISEGRCI